jgi:hypothetical protein
LKLIKQRAELLNKLAGDLEKQKKERSSRDPFSQTGFLLGAEHTRRLSVGGFVGVSGGARLR